MEPEERTAVLETKVERLIEEMDLHRVEHAADRDELKSRMETMHKEIMAEIAPIKADWQKYKGAAGMAVLVASMLWAGVLFFKEQILSWFK